MLSPSQSSLRSSFVFCFLLFCSRLLACLAAFAVSASFPTKIHPEVMYGCGFMTFRAVSDAKAILESKEGQERETIQRSNTLARNSVIACLLLSGDDVGVGCWQGAHHLSYFFLVNRHNETLLCSSKMMRISSRLECNLSRYYSTVMIVWCFRHESWMKSAIGICRETLQVAPYNLESQLGVACRRQGILQRF